MIGWKSNADVRAALSRARALVLPSLAEDLARMGRIGRDRVAALHDQDRNAAALRDLIEAAEQAGSDRAS